MTSPLTLALLYFSLLPWFLPAQPVDLKFDRFTQWENCPAGPILDIWQDDRNFLWLRAPAGHFRFDGNAFEFLSPPGATPAPPAEGLSTRCTDAAGNTWRGDTCLRRYVAGEKRTTNTVCR